MNPTYDFSGQVAFVTGAASGMGLAAAQAFATAGAALALVDANAAALAEAEAEAALRAVGANAGHPVRRGRRGSGARCRRCDRTNARRPRHGLQ
jgi:NAD(P)-dependent dehydrogenase (short-subunit alcohol dehydrogenase family)